MSGITREMIEEQLRSLADERQGKLNDLHRIAGAETVCNIQLRQLREQEQKEQELKEQQAKQDQQVPAPDAATQPQS